MYEIKTMNGNTVNKEMTYTGERYLFITLSDERLRLSVKDLFLRCYKSKNVVAVQSNKRQAKTEMNAGLIKVMFSNQTR